MKTVILCGGLGTRLSEETTLRPKPMVEIGGKPILCHIMDIYNRYNYNDFILALGYKGEFIKDYFMNYHARNSDFQVNLKSGKINFQKTEIDDWNVNLINTGPNTMTGGRLLRLKKVLKGEKTFMLTYGDGVADIDIDSLINFHKSHSKIATVTSVRPAARFGGMKIENNQVKDY